MAQCELLEPLVEAFVDGTLDPTAAQLTHLDQCDVCRGRLEAARAIHSLLETRELPVPPASFTAKVMARVQRERWAGEQFVDFGFNLAIAAGVLLIAGGAIGLAWSFGLLTFGVDVRGLVATAADQWLDRAAQQVQTFLVATILLITTLGLWWWAESEA